MMISELDGLCEVLRFAGFMAYGLGKPLTLWMHGLRVEVYELGQAFPRIGDLFLYNTNFKI